MAISNINDLGSMIPDLSKGIGGVSWAIIAYIIIGLIVVVTALYFFLKRGKLKWNIQLYERDASGIPIPLDVDVLDEKVINKGKNTVYTLRKYQALAHPPISKFIYRRKKGLFGTELWCDYLRERQDFIPVQRMAELGLKSQDDVIEFSRRMLEIYENKPEEARQKFIYSPLIPVAIARLKYEPMDYNMTEMLQVRLTQREMLYSDKQGFMQTYGPVIGVGIAAVCIIVVAFLAFQFATTNISQTTQAANAVAEKLGNVIASMQNAGLND